MDLARPYSMCGMLDYREIKSHGPYAKTFNIARWWLPSLFSLYPDGSYFCCSVLHVQMLNPLIFVIYLYDDLHDNIWLQFSQPRYNEGNEFYAKERGLILDFTGSLWDRNVSKRTWLCMFHTEFAAPLDRAAAGSGRCGTIVLIDRHLNRYTNRTALE